MDTFRHSAGNSRSDECAMTAYQLVGVSAEIKITPTVECGSISVTCMETETTRKGKHRRPGWEHCEGKSCKLHVHQELCVAVPVTFRTSAVCKLDQVVCGPASMDPCACLPPGFGDDSGSDSSGGSTGSLGSGSDSSGSRSDSAGPRCEDD